MKLPRLIWPEGRPAPGGIARLGRVLHWATTAVAALLLIVFFAALLSMVGAESPDWGATLTAMFAAFAFFMAGRAIRYILAGE